MSTDVSEVRAAVIALMMETAHTSDMLVDIHLRTRQYIPEDSELHHSRCSYVFILLLNSNVLKRICILLFM
jgi:hypothetical protein